MRKSFVAASFVWGALFTLVYSPSNADDRRGIWVNVTPSNADVANKLDCDNFRTTTMAEAFCTALILE